MSRTHANIDSSVDALGRGTIDDDESSYSLPGVGYSLNPTMYGFLEQIQEIRWSYGVNGEPIPEPIFVQHAWQKNDFVVTEGSSWCLGTSVCAVASESGHLIWIPAPFAHWKATHGSVVDGEVAKFIRRLFGIAMEADLEL